jgi:hypothetical protein
VREFLFILPAAVLVASWATLLGAATRQGRGDWRGAFLRACAVWGALAAISAEVLSPFGAVRQVWLGVFWGLVLGLLVVYSVRKQLFRSAWIHLRDLKPGFSLGERLILVGIAAVVLLLLLIAWVSPPNNFDSYMYHMARVVHWAQAGSLDHYPAGYEHQLTKPTWAETAILHLRVLWGDDKPANLVQWFSMVGSLIGVSAIGGLLGGSRKAQLLASTVALSIPMGILQATSTQNDYVVALWMVCLAYFVVKRRGDAGSRVDGVYVGLAAGLGLLTKGPGYVYAVPFLVWHLWPRRPWPRMSWVRDIGIIAGIVVLLNLGFWWRNVVTFGGPFGTSEFLSMGLTLGPELVTSQPSGEGDGPAAGNDQVAPEGQGAQGQEQGAEDAPLSIVWKTAASIAGKILETPRRVAQMVAYQLATPIGKVTRLVATILEAFPSVFPEDQTSRIRRMSWNHEDFAASPLNMVLAVVTGIGAWLIRKRPRLRLLCLYASAVALTYLLLPIVIGHVTSVWGIRYQLPFFVLWAPIAACVMLEVASERVAIPAACLLVLLSLPYVFFNNIRPLIGATPYTTRIESILTTDRTEVLLDNSLQRVQNDYAEAAAETFAQGCTTVGLIGVTLSLPEYPFWWILDAPQSGIRIESLSHSVYTERYVDPSFKPCLIICAGCEASASVPEYFLVRIHGPFSVWRLE